jgi:hypothetical protein
MTKRILLYYVYKNIPMVPFIYIIKFILFFLIILDRISFMKIKILKQKHQNLNLKLNGLYFVELYKYTFSNGWKSVPKGVTIVCFHPL